MEIDWSKLVDWVTTIGATVGSFALMMFLKRILRPTLYRKFDHGAGHIILQSLNGPINVLILYISLVFGLRWSPNKMHLRPEVITSEKIIFLIFFFWISSRLTYGILNSPRISQSTSPSGRRMISMLVHILIVVFFVMGVLDVLGISITPIIASLGVGSLAVALALQDTLNNFFSGIYIYLDKPFRVGDYIGIDGGKEGIVKTIGWRSTHILLGSDDTLVVPNNKLSTSIITNFDFPQNFTTVSVDMMCSISSNLQKVEDIVKGVAKDLSKDVPGTLETYETKVQFYNFSGTSVRFLIIIGVKHATDQSLIRSEVIKRTQAALIQAGITFS